jgi:adenylate cyclase
MSPRSRLKFTKLGVILITWMAIGVLITCYDFFVLKSNLSIESPRYFSFGRHLVISLTAAVLGALMGGSFLIFYVNEKFRDKPYGLTVLAVVLSFVVVVSIITVVLALIIAYMQSSGAIRDPEFKTIFTRFLSDPLHIKNIIVWSPVVAFTQIMLQFNTKFGEGSMWDLVRGKYQVPREEQRIFMFMDLNNSTSIAEKLGDLPYHQLLKDFFASITNPILDNQGEIYQYVGDEVVIAWKYNEGIQNNHCIKCFFDMKEQINNQSNYYISRYGITPSFKAGLHCGRVIAGEVGIIKRDVTFSGDVLNTTSRIQGKCKEYGAELISSDRALKDIRLSSNYAVELLGSIKLRGKEKEILLNAITPAGRTTH